MKIVTIIEDNPITGIRYGTVEIKEYNNITQRRLDRYYNFHKNLKRITYKKTNHKAYNG